MGVYEVMVLHCSISQGERFVQEVSVLAAAGGPAAGSSNWGSR